MYVVSNCSSLMLVSQRFELVFVGLAATHICDCRWMEREWIQSLAFLHTTQRCLPAHQNTIWLPLKVILSEHNHTQSNAQTSYITQTVNSHWLYFPLTENSLQPIYNFTLSHQLKKAVGMLKFSRTMAESRLELTD